MSIIMDATDRGAREYQEDALLWESVPEGTLLGVFDGHGGSGVSTLLAQQFAKLWSALDGDRYLDSLIKIFAMADDLTRNYHSGSTASVVFIPHDERKAYIAVLGDSPVLAEQADGSLFIGPDHNARSNQEERSKAIVRGGIYYGGYMWSDEGSNAKGLQMTRAFGDYDCRNFLDRTPEVATIELGSFLLIGSDGIFDPSHKSREAYDDILACIRNNMTPGYMVEQAVAIPTNDNASAILWRRS